MHGAVGSMKFRSFAREMLPPEFKNCIINHFYVTIAWRVMKTTAACFVVSFYIVPEAGRQKKRERPANVLLIEPLKLQSPQHRTNVNCFHHSWLMRGSFFPGDGQDASRVHQPNIRKNSHVHGKSRQTTEKGDGKKSAASSLQTTNPPCLRSSVVAFSRSLAIIINEFIIWSVQY